MISSVRDRLLQADFHIPILTGLIGVKLRPVQIAPQELAEKVPARRGQKGEMRRRIGGVSRDLCGGRWRPGARILLEHSPAGDITAIFLGNMVAPELLLACRIGRTDDAELPTRRGRQFDGAIVVEPELVAMSE